MAGSQGACQQLLRGLLRSCAGADAARLLAADHPGDRADQSVVYRTVCCGAVYVATVQPSGSNLSLVEGLFSSYQQAFLDFYVSDSASACNTGSDGTEAAPAAVAATGWWPGLLCGYGHAAWSSLNVKGNRSLTLEVTAQDEQGLATIAKAMPVIGVWNATDARGSLPGVASASRGLQRSGHRNDHADHVDYATETVTNSNRR